MLTTDVITSLAYEDALYYAEIHKPKDLPPNLEKFYLETFVKAWVYSYNHAIEFRR